MTAPMTLPKGWLYERDNPTRNWRGTFVRRTVDSAFGAPEGYAIRWLEEADSSGRTRRKAVAFLKLPVLQ